MWGAHTLYIFVLDFFSLLKDFVSLLDSSASLPSRWEHWGYFCPRKDVGQLQVLPVPFLQLCLLLVQPMSSPSRGTAVTMQPLLALRFAVIPVTISHAELLQGALFGSPVCRFIDLHIDLPPQLCFYAWWFPSMFLPASFRFLGPKFIANVEHKIASVPIWMIVL